MERPAFERELAVLEPNRLLRGAAVAMALVGPIAFFLALARVFPFGVFGIHLAFLGALLLFGLWRHNLRPKRATRTVRADAQGIHVDGKLAVPHAAIAAGFFQPRLKLDPRKSGAIGSSVRVLGRRRGILFEAEVNDEEASTILATLGLDAASKRAQFNGSPPFYATLGRNLAFGAGLAFFGVAFMFATAALGVGGGVFPLVLFPLIFASLWPSKIEIGVDGVHLGWAWRKKFIPMREIVSVFPIDDREIHIVLRSGVVEKVYTSMRRRNQFNTSYALHHRDAVLARINEALDAFRRRGPIADVSALVSRGNRTPAEWQAALRDLHKAADGGYRAAVVREEDLFRVVEDPTAPADARAGAASVLRHSLDADGKARLRVVAGATASPKLRVALDAITSDADESKLLDALDALADDPRPRQTAS